ncbi:MAG TPA: hypothetical protein VFS09_06470 [Candidatus Eisenbacteria bacterium]|nr:hypothetical protein [Candidatus Eisenbacteria bacterium]
MNRTPGCYVADPIIVEIDVEPFMSTMQAMAGALDALFAAVGDIGVPPDALVFGSPRLAGFLRKIIAGRWKGRRKLNNATRRFRRAVVAHIGGAS